MPPRTDMPDYQKEQCHKIIHTAAAASGAVGLSPLPFSDAVGMGAAQLAMVISLGKVFDISISSSVAKAIVGIGVASATGKTIVANALKFIPGVGTFLGGAISASTGAGLTEALGWMVADDFYRMSKGMQPQNIAEAVKDIQDNKLF